MDRKQVGLVVRRAYSRRNESSNRFAKRAGIAPRTLDSILAGERTPIARVKTKIETALGWDEGTYEWLLVSDVDPDELDPANPMRSAGPRTYASQRAAFRRFSTKEIMDELYFRINSLVQ